MIFIVSGIAALVGMGATSTSALHPIYLRRNPGVGLVRLSVWLAMAWIALVLWRFADPSVVGIYVAFYLVMGYAVVKVCGQTFASAFGAGTVQDVGERRNMAAALVAAAFTFSTGLIFGGSLWGEADPVGDDEGGWWIPLTFFLLGWGSMLLAFWLYRRREKGRFRDRLRRERSVADARAAAAFLLSAGLVLTDAVAGDFWGWRHGLVTFGLLAAMLIAHEAFSGLARQDDAGKKGGGSRALEAMAYLGLAVLAWGLNRAFDAAWGPG